MTNKQFNYIAPRLQIILGTISLVFVIILGVWWMGFLIGEVSYPPWFLHLGIITGSIAILLPADRGDCNQFYDAFFKGKE